MSAGDAAPPDEPPPEQSRRLDSWKEIAAYFQRDVRTVRRWEATEGLPVHRHQHRERGSVYAFPAELEAWRTGARQVQPAPPASASHVPRRRWWAVVPSAMIVIAGLSFLALRTGTTPDTSPQRAVRVAVLPFDSPNGDAAVEPLGSVIAADVVSKLGRLGPDRLGVVAYTSATSFKGSGKRVGQIGRELQANYLVEGDLRQADERIVLTVRLVVASNETLSQVWEYQRPRTALSLLADEVASDVVKVMAVRALAPRSSAAEQARPVDSEAYQLFLRARYHLRRRTGPMPLARQYLEAAIARAPEFAPAHAALSEVLSRIARQNHDVPRDAWTQSEAAARRALALDDALPAGHVMMGTIALARDWDWNRAETAYRRAIELAPQDPEACSAYAYFLRSSGRMDEAIRYCQRALDADPLNVVRMTVLGEYYVDARRYDDAIREFEKALELEPDLRMAVDGLADVCARKGLTEQAAVLTTRMLILRGSTALADGFERLVRTQGYRAAERWLDRQSLERYNQNPTANGWNLAFTYARLGDREAALQCLEKAFAQRDPGLLRMRVDPDVDSLRSDPRFQAILQRIGPQP